MASPESRSNWTPFRESGIPESAVLFAPKGNGVDIIRPYDEPGYVYEDDCFEALSYSFPDHYIVGAHLLDYMLTKDKALNSVKRPDAIFLKYMDGKTVISGISEFKLYPYTDFDAKLDGFSKFLGVLRSDPERLPINLKLAIGNFIKIPNEIHAPPDGRITKTQVTLITPPIEEKKERKIYKRRGMHINRLAVSASTQSLAA